MSNNTGAGLGDPYWYEWSVGQSYVIDMLDPRSTIASVTLQKTGEKGLDDVVVRYLGGNTRFIQVKHTRAEDTLTFGDFVESVGDKPPLLRQLAMAWNVQLAAVKSRCEVVLVTNRAMGTRRSSTKGKDSLQRPPLDRLLAHLAEAITPETIDLAALVIPPEWQAAWKREWLPQLEPLGSDDQILNFLRCFRVESTDQGLEAAAAALDDQISRIFAVDVSVARRLRSRLDSALRDWATSARGEREAVTREMAYEQLCLVEDVLVGEHALPPPAPFFASRTDLADKVAALLEDRTAAVVFVVGEPGSGKTALLSALANRRSPVIGARFHAYRPITPSNQLVPTDAGRTTTARALWSDLLLLISDLARGRLSEYRVPIHAGSLSTDKLREHVLRLANELGRAEGRPFVIAIDGIDHAARAGFGVDSFLASLVPPEQVPPNVVFLIAGQRPQGYPNYPVWLRTPTSDVRHVELPRLNVNDTTELLRTGLPNAPNDEVENAARDIWQRCEGLTLSTVFAVEEAVLSETLSELSATLDRRGIASGVEGYYESIWRAATKPFVPTMALRLAACLCLVPVRVVPAMVQAVVGADLSVIANWGDVLRQLRPLVTEDPTGFRVFHNDVRVFLQRQLLGDADVYRDSASRLADYLRVDGDARARHAAAQNLFGIAQRHAEQASLFSPAYVLEGHVVGQSLDELTEQGLVAAEALRRVTADWDLAHGVAAGLETLVQLRASLQWRDAGTRRRPTDGQFVGTKPVERRVLPRQDWTPDLLAAALTDIAELLESGERHRASDAFCRWFDGLSPVDVARALVAVAPQDSGRPIEEMLRGVLAKMGEVSAETVLLRRSDYNDDNAERAEADFAIGLFTAAARITNERTFAKILRRVTSFSETDAQKLLRRLTITRAWRRSGLVLWILGSNSLGSWSFRLQCAMVAAILGGPSMRRRWIVPVLQQRSQAVAAAVALVSVSSDIPSQIEVMSWVALLLGIEEPQRESSNIRSEIETAFHANRRDERQDAAIAQTLHAAALLGKLIRAILDGLELGSIVQPKLIAATVESLTVPSNNRLRSFAIDVPSVLAPLVDGLAECASRDPTVSTAVRQVFEARLTDGVPPDAFLDTVWRTLHSAGQRAELVAYADSWIGANGRAWRFPLAERFDAVRSVARQLKTSGEVARAEAARDCLLWADIGYAGHKEYALEAPREWFSALADRNVTSWRDEGLRLFALSREASRTGDNRIGWTVEAEVISAACREGPSAVAAIVLAENSVLDVGDDTLVRGLVAALDRTPLERHQLLAVWAYCTGQLRWQVPDDRTLLAQARDALLAAGVRTGIADLAATMADLAPAEYASEVERDRAETPRDEEWVDTLAVVEAIQRACDTNNWSAAARVLNRAKAEAQNAVSDVVRQIRSALDCQQETEWWFDRVGTIYEVLFPLLTPEERWQVVVRSVAQPAHYGAEARARMLAKNIDNMCRLAAMVDGPQALARGTQRLLSMQELWVSGDGRLPPVAAVPLAKDIRVADWSVLFSELLLRSTALDEGAFVLAALRGIHRLSGLATGFDAELTALLQKAEPLVQRRVLLIAESIAKQPNAIAFRGWLSQMMTASRLDERLGAWNGLRSAYHALGGAAPTWPAPTDELPRIAPVAAPLLVVAPTQKGMYRSTGRASTKVLAYLQSAINEQVADVESELAASVRDDPPQSRPRSTRDGSVGDMTTNHESEAELDRLYAILDRRERQGRFRAVALPGLAAVVGPFADPSVFLRTPRPSTSSTSWPVDEQLDKFVAAGDLALEQRCAAVLVGDLDPSVRVLAGALRTFSRRFDVMVSVDHVVDYRVDLNRDDERPTIINARASLALEAAGSWVMKQGARDQEWLTTVVGGLCAYADATLDFFPTRLWRSRFDWVPSASDPLVWTRAGHRVAWFERLRGPLRRVGAGDFVYRQPTIARWVCVAVEWSRIEEILGRPQQRIVADVCRFKDE